MDVTGLEAKGTGTDAAAQLSLYLAILEAEGRQTGCITQTSYTIATALQNHTLAGALPTK